MTANELRIGNYLYYHITDNLDKRKEWDEINAVDAEDILCISNGRAEDLSPIPLTKEWLIRLGFVKHISDDNYIENNIEDEIYVDSEEEDTYVSLNTKHFATMFSLSGYGGLKYIEYVHQLQNLYFALTGNELKIKKNDRHV